MIDHRDIKPGYYWARIDPGPPPGSDSGMIRVGEPPWKFVKIEVGAPWLRGYQMTENKSSVDEEWQFHSRIEEPKSE